MGSRLLALAPLLIHKVQIAVHSCPWLGVKLSVQSSSAETQKGARDMEVYPERSTRVGIDFARSV